MPSYTCKLTSDQRCLCRCNASNSVMTVKHPILLNLLSGQVLHSETKIKLDERLNSSARGTVEVT